MDKLQLTPEQLDELRLYIRKRGIQEPDVINEVLDHFACKAEELMTADPRLPWSKVIREAHQSFGSTGFRPIVAAYESAVTGDLKQAYRRALQETLLSPALLFCGSAALLSVLISRYIPVLPGDHWFSGMDLYYMGLLCLWAILKYRLIIRHPALRQGTAFWQKSAISLQELPLLVIWLGPVWVGQPNTLMGPWINALIFFIGLLTLAAHRKLVRYAVARYTLAT